MWISSYFLRFLSSSPQSLLHLIFIPNMLRREVEKLCLFLKYLHTKVPCAISTCNPLIMTGHVAHLNPERGGGGREHQWPAIYTPGSWKTDLHSPTNLCSTLPQTQQRRLIFIYHQNQVLPSPISNHIYNHVKHLAFKWILLLKNLVYCFLF